MCGFAEEAEAAALKKARGGAKRKAVAPLDAETLQELAELDVEVSEALRVRRGGRQQCSNTAVQGALG